MLARLMLLFILVPLVEFYLLMWVAQVLSVGWAIAITILTGVVGGTLAKREGLKVFRRWRQALAELRPPEEGVVEGLLVLVGGVLLVTPGVLTDVVGLSLLLPPARRVVANAIRARVDRHLELRQVSIPGAPGPARRGRGGQQVIDTTGEIVDL